MALTSLLSRFMPWSKNQPVKVVNSQQNQPLSVTGARNTQPLQVVGSQQSQPLSVTSSTQNQPLSVTSQTATQPLSVTGDKYATALPFGVSSLQSMMGVPTSITAASVPSLVSNPAPTNPTGATAPDPVDRSRSIAAANANLSGAEVQRNSALARLKEILAQIGGGYDDEVARYRADYEGNSDTNKNNLLRNTQAALLNAAKGRQGLFGVLSSIGALSGSGIDLANRAVQTGANADLLDANDEFGGTQASLENSWGSFENQDKLRREALARQEQDFKRDTEYNYLTNVQKLYNSLSDDYAAMGNTGEANRYAEMARSSIPQSAELSIPAGLPQAMGASYTPVQLSRYVGGEAPTTVRAEARSGNQLPNLIAALNPFRRRTEKQ